MPSLRRTLSSPVVRSSPYPTSSSSASNSATSNTRVQGHGFRRSSGSETVGRRVLADIEWWRVADGQRDLDAEQEAEVNHDSDHEQTPTRPAEDLVAGVGLSSPAEDVESPLSPVWSQFLSGTSEDLPLLPTDQLALLAIIPQTPPRRGHRLESSSSSLESTPEASEGPIEGLRLGIQCLDLGLPVFDSEEKPPASLQFSRSRSFADSLDSITTPRSDVVSDFADFAVFPLSSYSPEIFD